MILFLWVFHFLLRQKRVIFLTYCTIICFCSLFGGISKGPKILFVLNTFPSSTGGVAILNQITGLIDRGCEVHIYARKKGDLEKLPSYAHKYNLFDRFYLDKGKSKESQYERVERLYNLPEDLDTYDIIYCQFGNRGIPFADLVHKTELKAKVVTCFRGSDITSYIQDHPHIYDDLFIKGHRFLPVCDYFRKILIRHGCDPKKIIVHHSAIDCNKFFYRKKFIKRGEPIRIVTVCRLVEKKGLDYSIRAVARLISQYHPNIQYNIIGTGPLEESLTNLINKLGVARNIHLLGYAPQERVAEVLDASDIFVLTSVSAQNGDAEGIPNALKEAMAKGLPVISTYNAGISELIEDGKHGFLVVECDVTAIEQKIKFLINNPAVCIKFGKAGREKVYQEYDMKKLNDRLMIIFEKIMNS